MASEQTYIRIWNRAQRREEVEQVYGEELIRLLYGSPFGQKLSDRILSRATFSRVYGTFQSSFLSRRKIKPFIADFQIDMNEFESGPFRSFNDFFIRKFRPGARTFAAESNRMPAFAEARYFGYYDDAPTERSLPVKGKTLDRSELLGPAHGTFADSFKNGPVLVARLCPTDYHRYHYPDDGETVSALQVPGPLHSVNPLALKYKPRILSTNERRVTILKTKNFGLLAYVEVGALCVGKIVQTHPEPGSFVRGAEKGYFLFGGSTVVLLGERNTWKPSPDILEQTTQGRETLVRLGEEIATLS